jgi:hypothetical protein
MLNLDAMEKPAAFIGGLAMAHHTTGIQETPIRTVGEYLQGEDCCCHHLP